MNIYDIAKLRALAQGMEQSQRFLVSRALDSMENLQREIGDLKDVIAKQARLNRSVPVMALELDRMRAELEGKR